MRFSVFTHGLGFNWVIVTTYVPALLVSSKVTLRNLGRLRHIPVGTAHKNRKVNLLVAGPDVRIITDDGELLGL